MFEAGQQEFCGTNSREVRAKSRRNQSTKFAAKFRVFGINEIYLSEPMKFDKLHMPLQSFEIGNLMSAKESDFHVASIEK